MALFCNVEDELLIDRTSAFEEIRLLICELVAALKINSYKDMIRSDRDLTIILEKEKSLRKKLARPAQICAVVEDAPRLVKMSFLIAHRLAALYPETVSSIESVLSSIKLKTFPLFRPSYAPPKNKENAYALMTQQFHFSPEEECEINAPVERARSKISKKRALVTEIRKHIEHDNEHITSDEVLRLYGLLFGAHPFLPGELELVVTDTALYFWMQSIDGFTLKVNTSSRSEPEKQVAIEYVKSVRKFRFEHFSNFPVFSFFDVRNADQDFIQVIRNNSLACDPQFDEIFNSIVAVEETEKIEKYLIHDSWGHVWEDDFTNIKQFYQELVLLSLPLAPDVVASTDEGSINLSDVISITSAGEVHYHEEKAKKFIDSILEQRLSALLAPLCAELCADVIEYHFVSSFENANAILPSSSLFRVDPTKLDFAWTDIHFFSEHFLKSLLIYEQNLTLRQNFIDRVLLLVKGRYTGFAEFTSPSFDEEARAAVESFLLLLSQRAHCCCSTEMPMEANNVNEFFLLFTNLLQIQSTINKLLHEVIDQSFPELKRYQEILIIATLTYFCESPLSHFWSIDEMISAWAIPILKAIHEAESYNTELLC